MIIHTVKFERPVAGASLVVAPGTSVGRSDANANPEPATAGHDAQAQAHPGRSADPEAVALLIKKLVAGVNQVHTQSDKWVGEVRRLSVRLAKMIVAHVVGSSEEMRTERLESLLQASLVRPEPPIAAFVHPEDLGNIQDLLESSGLDLQPDSSLRLGECRVEYSSHELISNLQLQLDQIEDRLAEVFKDD